MLLYGRTAKGTAWQQGAPEEVEVRQEDFVAAADSLQPSLSAQEVAKCEAIRDSYAGQQRKQYWAAAVVRRLAAARLSTAGRKR